MRRAWWTVGPPQAVNVEVRRDAARLLRDYVRGAIDNDTLDERWPQGRGDEAVDHLARYVWLFYDDLETHHFDGGDEARRELERCARFLESDLPYVWHRPPSGVRAAAEILSLVTLGLAGHLWQPTPEHWPFPTPASDV